MPSLVGDRGDGVAAVTGADPRTLTGAGTDLPFGNIGDDVLTGGLGADVSGFGRGDGRDEIADLVTGGSEPDLIAFNGGAFADGTAVLAARRQEGTDAVIAYGADAGDALTLRGVQLGSLSAANLSSG